jgi:hypothetical protein
MITLATEKLKLLPHAGKLAQMQNSFYFAINLETLSYHFPFLYPFILVFKQYQIKVATSLSEFQRRFSEEICILRYFENALFINRPVMEYTLVLAGRIIYVASVENSTIDVSIK